MQIHEISPSTRPREAMTNTQHLLTVRPRDDAWREAAQTELSQLQRFIQEGETKLVEATEAHVKQHITTLLRELNTARLSLNQVLNPTDHDDWSSNGTTAYEPVAPVVPQPPVALVAKETEYLHKGNIPLAEGSFGDVIITNIRAIFGSKTYAMSGVTSVSMVKISPNNGLLKVMFGIGLLLIIPGLQSGTLLTVGLGLAAISGILLYLEKPSYAVNLVASSGEHKALISKDQLLITAIVGAINQAMVSRG